MLDATARYWEIFKNNVKLNPFEVFSYARNIINRDRPVRSVLMILALSGGMAGGAFMFLTKGVLNEWAAVIVLQFIPNILLDALGGISSNVANVFIQVMVAILGAYLGSALVGTAIKQAVRTINKIIFGTTNSMYDLTAGDLDFILEKNPQYKTTDVPVAPDNVMDCIKVQLNKLMPMAWMQRWDAYFPEALVPQGVKQDRENLWQKIQFVRSFKKRYKHDGTKRDSAPKHALKTLINGEYNINLEEFVANQVANLQRKQQKSAQTIEDINALLGDNPNYAAPVDLGEHHLYFNNLLPHLKRVQSERSRVNAFVHHEGEIRTYADLHQLKLKVQKEHDKAALKLEAIAPYRLAVV